MSGTITDSSYHQKGFDFASQIPSGYTLVSFDYWLTKGINTSLVSAMYRYTETMVVVVGTTSGSTVSVSARMVLEKNS